LVSAEFNLETTPTTLLVDVSCPNLGVLITHVARKERGHPEVSAAKVLYREWTELRSA